MTFKASRPWTRHLSCSSPADPSRILHSMRLVWKSLDKMRCLRKRSTIPFLGFLITFLLFLNLYIEDGYVLVSTFKTTNLAPVCRVGLFTPPCSHFDNRCGNVFKFSQHGPKLKSARWFISYSWRHQKLYIMCLLFKLLRGSLHLELSSALPKSIC